MGDLLKCLHSYFMHLRIHVPEWEKLMKKAEGPLAALTNLDEQLQLVQRAKETDSELLTLPNFKENLFAKLRLSIEEELLTIKSIIEDCTKAIVLLENKEMKVEQNFLIDWDSSFEQSVLAPSIYILMEWVGDATRYYQSFIADIKYSLLSFDFNGEQTMVNLRKAFEEDPIYAAHIRSILTYTQFMGLDEQ